MFSDAPLQVKGRHSPRYPHGCRIYSALQGIAVTVPTFAYACKDESSIGSEFYLMERIDGDVTPV